MACRLPGGIESPQDLWDLLLCKGDARTRVPESRYNASAFHWPSKKPGHVISEHGYFLNDTVDLGGLDASVFPMPRSELEVLDPQQRLLFEVTKESFDDAGEVEWRGSNTGVFVGSFGNEWYDVVQKESQRHGTYHISHSYDFALSNRVSYELDLHGPSLTIRTACSSSLVALSQACAAISNGDCPSAIVGGTSIIIAPSLTIDESNQGALSPDGSCKTFSSDADGYGRGEGIVALYIKPLSDALRDGNPIRAVLAGTATNCDGKTPGFTVPSADAQEALIRHTYRIAGIPECDIRKTGFFECHGTGTQRGDTIETSAITRVFSGTDFLHIGSVKPNLGHGEGASGLTAVLKAVLSLENQTILPNIKCLPLNPNIPFDKSGLIVPQEPISWPEGREKRISINSFGIGGANAHAIIESPATWSQYSAHVNKTANKAKSAGAHHLLLYSAQSAYSIDRMTEQYAALLEDSQNARKISDLAYTLARRRQHLSIRSFTVRTRDSPGVTFPPQQHKGDVSVVMVFTGQGSQWPQMGRELLRTNDVFKTTIQSLDKELQTLGSLSPDWKLEDEILKPSRTSRVNEAEFAQPLCAALQIALLHMFDSVGVKPAAVVGHSSGEIAAAYAAKAITAREAILIAYLRGLVSKSQTKPGAMAALGMSFKEAEKFLVPGVVVGCDNSPNSVTISGDTSQVQTVLNEIKQASPAVLTSTLKVERAYHSHHMVEVGGEYYDRMVDAEVVGNSPAIPFFSSVLGGSMMSSGGSETSANHVLGPEYWRKNLEQPVLFNAAASSLLDSMSSTSDNLVLLEIGPHAALAGPLRQILAAHPNSAGALTPHIATMTRHRNSSESFLTAVGKLWAHGANIDFKALIPEGKCLPNLPRYPWNHQRSFWSESRVAREWRFREHSYHDLLGARVAESSGIEPVWRNVLHLENAPWIRDHKIKDDIVFPFAGFVAMAAEAARQVSGIQEAVELRHVVVSTALVVYDHVPTELVTTLRRHRLTDVLDSHWWEFTVTAHNGHVWTKHCFGEVRAVQDFPVEDAHVPDIANTPHKVDIRQWYDRVSRGGLRYGPHFQTMKELKTSATGPKGLGVTEVERAWPANETKQYHLHPVILDTFLQVAGVAAHHGFTHAYRQAIPSSAEYLALKRSTATHFTIAASCDFGNGKYLGHGSGVAGPESMPCLKVLGAQLTPLDSSEDDMSDEVAINTARSEWVPHIDLIAFDALVTPIRDNSPYFDTLDELGKLAIEICRRRSLNVNLDSLGGHLQNYVQWLNEHEYRSMKDLDDETLSSTVDNISASLSNGPAAPISSAISKVCAHVSSVLSEQTGALGALYSSDTMNNFLRSLNGHDISGFLTCLSQNKPDLCILELGAGLGPMINGTHQRKHSADQMPFSQYVYTEKSSGLLHSAQRNFQQQEQQQHKIEFTVLDISKDPKDQGFHDRRFDVIIAGGAIQWSGAAQQSLSNVCKLLNENGHFLFQQSRSDLTWAGFVQGVVPSWWNHSTDSASNIELDTMRWDNCLKMAGFGGITGAVPDAPEPYHFNTMMIARPQPHNPKLEKKEVTLLHGQKGVLGLEAIIKALEAQGWSVSYCTIKDLPTPGQDIISLLDSEEPFLETMDEESLGQLQQFVMHANDSRCGIFWVTEPTQMNCVDPRYAPVIGLARSLRVELGIDFATCEIEHMSSPKGVLAMTDAFARFHARSIDAKPDYEFASSNGLTRVHRILPCALEDDSQAIEKPATDRTAIRIDRLGRLDSLNLVTRPKSILEENELEIEVHAVALNFRDVLEAMGHIECADPDRIAATEASGIIRRVGHKVTNFSVGDRVMAIGRGACSTELVTSELLCAKMPDDLDFVHAASLPIVFVTAIYSLIEIGRLSQGQTVLIHSGCGGVGLAAIQIAQMIGADIYTTVGSEQKAKYLVDTLNIPRNRIFSSRSPSFLEDILRETGGKGVDLALNSLSGELLHATWHCIAKWGTMVEIGKIDLLGSGKLDMGVFLKNRSYTCFDLRQLIEDRPLVVSRTLRSLTTYYEQKFIKPIALAQVSSLSSARDYQDALRYMQQGNHIGKIIMTMRSANGELELRDVGVVPKFAVALDPLASYLLIGGFGGLGRSVCIWMVQHGARHLTLLSRSIDCGSPQELDFVHLLSSMGCTTRLVRGSVSDAADVARVVSKSSKQLKGVIHMAMVLRDRSFDRMSFDDWNSTMAPKVTGAWNLHKHLGTDLDFFILFSSLSGLLGQPGQANYAAANTFLDSFAQYRNGIGLPCTSLDIGAVEGVGYLSQNQSLLNKMRGTGWHTVKEEQVLEALNAAVASCVRSTSQGHQQTENSWLPVVERNKLLIGISPDDSANGTDHGTRLQRDIRLAAFSNARYRKTTTDASNSKDDQLRRLLSDAKSNPRVLATLETTKMLTEEIGRRLFSLLLKPDEEPDPRMGLAELGLDSLVAVELRAWCKRVLGVDISVLEMMAMGTLEALGKKISKTLADMYGSID
uniref:Polyketide synthase n=1 Tax=Pestalotiopsis microspora TaxID=85828 RepID=A0A1P8NTL0_PESMI|nr:polyketide synthase [Pestalotiopsis microspora]